MFGIFIETFIQSEKEIMVKKMVKIFEENKM